mmetsp:Transcript_27228/g.77901  ORF Transcript_27228/g.77901 Transcript_27228/m.77901 type:complete len:233 (+) Transcript_27228:1187-1885(+)
MIRCSTLPVLPFESMSLAFAKASCGMARIRTSVAARTVAKLQSEMPRPVASPMTAPAFSCPKQLLSFLEMAITVPTRTTSIDSELSPTTVITAPALYVTSTRGAASAPKKLKESSGKSVTFSRAGIAIWVIHACRFAWNCMFFSILMCCNASKVACSSANTLRASSREGPVILKQCAQPAPKIRTLLPRVAARPRAPPSPMSSPGPNTFCITPISSSMTAFPARRTYSGVCP